VAGLTTIGKNCS